MVVTSKEPRRLRREKEVSKALGIFFCKIIVVVRSIVWKVPVETMYEKTIKKTAIAPDIKKYIFGVTLYIITVILFR